MLAEDPKHAKALRDLYGQIPPLLLPPPERERGTKKLFPVKFRMTA
jgi:hypothetical protein